jgi:CHASE2 domain-containing sensor protein
LGNKVQIAKYAGVLTICFALGILAGFNPLAVRVDHYAYDLMLAGLRDTWRPWSVVVAIDEETLAARGGVRNMRSILAEALDKIYDASPEAIAIDVILADKKTDRI